VSCVQGESTARSRVDVCPCCVQGESTARSRVDVCLVPRESLQRGLELMFVLCPGRVYSEV